MEKASSLQGKSAGDPQTIETKNSFKPKNEKTYKPLKLEEGFDMTTPSKKNCKNP